MRDFIEDIILPIVIPVLVSTAIVSTIILGMMWLTGATDGVGETEPEVPVVETVPEKEYLGLFETTAYCGCGKCCGKWADGITKSGTTATEGRTVAVDPDIVPLGSVIEIGGQWYVAEDIGVAIKGSRIDVFFNEHVDALQYGRQSHEVFLISKKALAEAATSSRERE
jgi:3D (Asp-Asp-Asp) domain-containing protein